MSAEDMMVAWTHIAHEVFERNHGCDFFHLPMNDDHLYRDPDYPWDAYLQSQRSGIRAGATGVPG
jgi:hypothetical protein